MAINLPQFPQFDLSPRDTIPTRFEKWVKRLETLFKAMQITDAEQQQAMLLYYVGGEVNDIFETLKIPPVTPNAENQSLFDRSIAALKKHFEPQKCIDQHVYHFREESQKPDENVASFHTRLQLMAKKCEFTNPDLEIKRQIIQRCTSARLRRKAMEDELSLERLLKAAQAMELANERTAEMEQHTVNAMQGKPNSGHRKRYNNPGQNKNKNQDMQVRSNTQCGLCGGQYPHTNKPCPAKGKKCHNCGIANHFAHMCRKNQARPANKHQSPRPKGPRSNIHMVNEAESESEGQFTSDKSQANCQNQDEYTFFIGAIEGDTSSRPYFNIQLNNSKIKMMADSGASVNILSEKDYHQIQNKPSMENTSVKIFPYMSKNPLKTLGKIQAKANYGQTSTTDTFYVIEGTSSSLLCWDTSQKLNLIKTVNNTSAEPVHAEVQDILNEYKPVWNGLGQYRGDPVKITVDPSIKPVAQPHRRIPFHVRKQVEEKLMELERDDIIERAEGPTPWVSPIVVAPKPNQPNQIRICVDMREVNKAIERERHIIPTIDDVISDLNGCKVFGKIDLNMGYHQIMLHPESRHITTFSTHTGLWRYKRLNFGMTCAAEIFQDKVSRALEGIPGVKNLSDDIYIGGIDTKQHDERLRLVLQRLKEHNLTINLPKCKFRVPSMLFFGYVFSSEGISPDPKKVEALKKASAPTNPTEVRSLLSSVAFCSRFVPNFASITKPLRRLTCKDVEWQWSTTEQTAFDKLKEALSKDNVLGYFDPHKETEIYVDGSPIGLGAILTQRDTKTNTVTPLYYASKALNPTESRYSQTEREALAIYWAIRKFHLYVFGKKFKVITDAKPLVPIFNKPSSRPPARIERWLMNLQQYQFETVYEPGLANPADYPSRHPINDPSDTDSASDVERTEGYVSYIVTNAIPKAMTLQEVETATEKDPILQAVKTAVKTDQWYNPPENVSVADLSRYMQVKDELTVTNTVILKNNRIVIPAELQEKVINIAHEGHQGLVKTKSMLREKVWFPFMDRLVDQKVKACLPCQIATPVITREPLQMTTLPKGVFEQVSIDFASVDGETLLVLIDDYSRFPMVEPVSTTSAAAVIPKLDQMFAFCGTPEVVKSDNGTPFNSEEFHRFAKELGFQHRKVTPYWPRANGEVERFVRSLKKAVKTAKCDGLNWRKELQKFLRNYRTTPHTTTAAAPATLFHNRRVRNKLPCMTDKDPINDLVSKYDSEQKRKMKMYADNKQYVKPSNVKIGDTVLVRRPFNLVKNNTPYEKVPLTVTQTKGSMITAEGNGASVTRNSSFFKRIPTTPESESAGEENFEFENMDSAVDDELDNDDQEPPTTNDTNQEDETSIRPVRLTRKPMWMKDYVVN